MTRMRVKTDGLNLRSQPQVKPGNIIAVLPLAQEVDVVGVPAANNFVEVETDISGQTRQGFVSADFLRSPASQLKEALLRETVAQWIRFRRGDGKESIAPFIGFVGEFWHALNPPLNLDGGDTDQPWSAAFISFVVRSAGYQGFMFSPAHARYILDAKAKRQANNANAPFWLFRLSEHRPQVGDLICKRRQQGVTFDNLPVGGFKSHCDVVVEVRDRTVRTLGGNVSNSVAMTSYSLNDNGFVKQEGPVFAIMRNNN